MTENDERRVARLESQVAHLLAHADEIDEERQQAQTAWQTVTVAFSALSHPRTTGTG